MKINIAASHRFHVLDLARELAALGHDVRFYSYVPTKRCTKFGLRTENCRSLFFLLLPLLALAKLFKNPPWVVALTHRALDSLVSHLMPRCDVFIGLGTVYKDAFVHAKQKFGATTIVEWGSKHVLDQQEILAKVTGKRAQHPYFTKRSIAGYELAEFISLPAEHAVETFTARGIPRSKLLVNPYGVDLSMFYPTVLAQEKQYDLITVGAWSLQKGSDLLTTLCTRESWTLLHVGPIVDVEFPARANMTHVDPVDQSALVNYFAKARVFVHPSRQDGLAMVQCQAIACGLPLVYSKNSGGRDLSDLLSIQDWVFELDDLSIESITESVRKGLELSYKQASKTPRNYAGNKLERMTWQSYGRRYGTAIDERVRTLQSNLVR